MIGVSEKHMDRARQIVWSVANEDMDADQVATALANAEREGMKRAAEIAREFLCQRQTMIEVEYAVNERFGGDATVDEFVPVIAERLASAILSEAGEN